MSSLDTAISNRRQSNFSPRIVQLSDRVAEQQVTVAGALLQSESGLRRVAIAEFEQQAIALSRSLGQSRLAVARLYDRSSRGVAVENATGVGDGRFAAGLRHDRHRR